MVVQSLDDGGLNLLHAVSCATLFIKCVFLQVSNVLAEGEEVVCQVVSDLIREIS